jgi:polyisoprenoid-binding protein YceI
MDSNAQNFIVAILAGSLAIGTLSAAPRTYELGPSEGSHLTFEVYKTGLMAGKKHSFVFERYSGHATLDEEKPQDASVRFVIDTRSVVCIDKWVNEENRMKIQLTARDEMMQADKYPEMVFTSSKVSPKGGGVYDVEGRLSIRGVERPALVHVVAKPGGFEGNARVKLSTWGMKPPSGLTLGLINTKDEMGVMFLLKPKAN